MITVCEPTVVPPVDPVDPIHAVTIDPMDTTEPNHKRLVLVAGKKMSEPPAAVAIHSVRAMTIDPMTVAQLMRKHALKRSRKPFVAPEQTRPATVTTSTSPIRNTLVIIIMMARRNPIGAMPLPSVAAIDPIMIRTMTTAIPTDPMTATALPSLCVPHKSTIQHSRNPRQPTRDALSLVIVTITVDSIIATAIARIRRKAVQHSKETVE
jgi:hypothetical protein